MKILMLAQFYPPIIGGEERHVRNLSIALAARGHDVSVATLAGADAPDFEVESGVKVYRIKGSMQRASFLFKEADRAHAPPFPDPELTLNLRRIIRREAPDIVHAHNWLVHSVLPLKSPRGPRLVLTLHDYSHVCARKNFMHEGKPCAGPATAKCLSCAGEQYGTAKAAVTTLANFASSRLERAVVDKFLTVSSAVAEGNQLARFGVPFEVVPNFVPDSIGVLSDEVDPRVDLLPKDGFILFVGDLQRLKGTDKLIEAYATLKGARPLVLIGRPGPDTPRNLPPNVTIHHNWPHTAIMHAWSRCTFGVAPSVWPEPCATVVMEAMGVGKPFIATGIGGMPDLVDDGVSGLIVPPGDVAALAAALHRLDSDAALRERMAAGARIKVQTLMAKAVVPRIERIYEELLGRKPQRFDLNGLHGSDGATPASAKPTTPATVATEGNLAARQDAGSADAVSVVVCVHSNERWDDIREAIGSLQAQVPRAPHVIVVSDRNEPLAERVKAAFPGVQVLMNALEPGLSGARNTGIKAARTAFVGFLDDDAVAGPSWIESMLGRLREVGVAGAGPHIAPIWLGKRPVWFPSEFLWTVGCSFRPDIIAATRVRNLSGAAMCFRRDLFERTGGFSPLLGRHGGKLPLSCEETEFCIRAGSMAGTGAFVLDPATSVGHKVPAQRLTLGYFTLRCYAEGISKAYLAQIVNSPQALATEREFASRTLTRAFVAELASVVRRGDAGGLARAAMLAYGTACAAAGYLRGSIGARARLSGKAASSALLLPDVVSQPAERAEHAR